MKIFIERDRIPAKSIVKLVFVGYLIGGGLLFLIPLAFGVMNALFVAPPEADGAAYKIPALFPVILVVQSVLFALVVALGLFVYNWLRGIELVINEKPEPPDEDVSTDIKV